MNSLTELLANCPPKSVIVLHNANIILNPVVEKIPTKPSKKADVINWLGNST